MQATVDALLGPGTVFYDIGGGVGLFSLLAAHKGAEVFVFEPYRVNADFIALHARMNSLEGSIHVLPLAAYSSSGQLTMELSQHGSQMAPPGRGQAQGGKGLDVACVTLDEFGRSHPAPTLVKVDVEGGESEVLKGAVELFERTLPSLICEVHDVENRRFVTEWLAERQYLTRWLGSPGEEYHLFGAPEKAFPGPSGAADFLGRGIYR